jgi:hypothetical protein
VERSGAPHLYNRKHLCRPEMALPALCQEFIAHSIAISNFLYSPGADELVERLGTLAE